MTSTFGTSAIDDLVREIPYRGPSGEGNIDRFREFARCVLRDVEHYVVECAGILRKYPSGQIPFGGQTQLGDLLPLGTVTEEEDARRFYGAMRKLILAIGESARNGGLPRGSDDLLFDALNALFFNRNYQPPKD